MLTKNDSSVDMVFDPSGQGHGMATPQGLAMLAKTENAKRYLAMSDAALEMRPFTGSVERGEGGGMVLRCKVRRPSLLLLSLTAAKQPDDV